MQFTKKDQKAIFWSEIHFYVNVSGLQNFCFRYKLLLEDVIKNTPDSHPDKTSLKEALEQIEHVAWHINEQLREHENNMKMVDIQKSLNGGFPKIIAPGRKLLKQGMLLKVPRTGGGN